MSICRANARYGLAIRRVAAAIGSKFSVTRTAPALVGRANGVYFGLATKVSCPGPAFSIPSTPVISCSWSPWHVAPRRRASSASFMEGIVPDSGGRVLGFEQVFLHSFRGAAPGSGLDDRQNIQFGHRLPGQKNPLCVGSCIGRDEENAFSFEQGQIIGRRALDNVIVLEPHSDPQPLATGAGDKGLAQQAFWLVGVP